MDGLRLTCFVAYPALLFLLFCRAARVRLLGRRRRLLPLASSLFVGSGLSGQPWAFLELALDDRGEFCGDLEGVHGSVLTASIWRW